MSDRFGNIQINQDPAKDEIDETQIEQITDTEPAEEETTATDIIETEEKPHQSIEERLAEKKANLQKNRPSSSKKLFIIPVLLVLVILGLYGCAKYLVPIFIVEKLPQILEEKYNLHLSIKNAEFDPIKFQVNIQGVEITQDDDEAIDAKLLLIDSLNVSLPLIAILRGDYVCKIATIERPEFYLTRYHQNNYNISRFLHDSNSDDKSEIISFAELPFFFSLNNINVIDGSVHFVDRPSGKIHEVDNIQVKLPTISNFVYETEIFTSPHISAVVNGSPFEISTNLPLSSVSKMSDSHSFSLDIKELDLKYYLNYLPFKLPMEISQGTVNGSIELLLNTPTETSEEQELSIGYKLNLKSVLASSNDGSLKANFEHMQLLGVYQPISAHLHLDNGYIKAPVFHTTADFSGATIQSLLPANTKETNTPAVDDKDLTFTINRLFLDNGQIYTTNKSADEERTWQSIEIAIKDFDSSATKENPDSTFSVNGNHNNSSTSFTWKGKFNAHAQPSGILDINKLPVSSICSTLFRTEATCSSGTADVRGTLSFENKKEYKKTIDFFPFTQGELTINGLSLTQNNKEWFSGKRVQFTDVTSKNNQTDVGHIDIDGANIIYRERDVPRPLSSMIKGTSGFPEFLSAELNGQGTVYSKNGKNPLLLPLLKIIISSPTKEKGEQKNIIVKASTDNGGKVDLKGNISLSSFETTLSMDFSKILSDSVLPLLGKNPFFIHSKSHMSGKGIFSYPMGGYAGSLEISKGYLADSDNPALNWDKMTITDVIYKREPTHLEAKSITLEQPNFTINTYDRVTPYHSQFTTFLNRLFQNQQPESDSISEQKDYRFDKLFIVDGTVSFVDAAANTHEDKVFDSINGSLSSIYYPADKVSTKIELEGTFLTKPVSLMVESDFFTTLDGNYQFTFTDLPLDQVASVPQSLGLNSAQATVSGKTTTNWTKSSYKTTHHLNISHLVPDSGNSTSGLALALLMDPSNSIFFDFEQATPNSDHASSLKDLATNHFKTFLIKTDISPLLLASEQFSDLRSVNSIIFNPGEDELDIQAKDTLSRIAVLLATYPKLKINLIGHLHPSKDKKAIEKRLSDIEQTRVDSENKSLLLEWQEKNDIDNILPSAPVEVINNADMIEESDINVTTPDFVPLEPQPIEITEQHLIELANNRGLVVYQFLTDDLGVNSDQLSVEQKQQYSQEINKHQVDITYTTLFEN